MKNTVVTCVYCGHEYPNGTPTAKAKLLTEHISVCQKHPMREAENKIKILRTALAGLVGVSADLDEELNEFEKGVCALAKMGVGPEKEELDTIFAALDALRKTK